MIPREKKIELILLRRWKRWCVPSLVISAIYFACAATILLDAANDQFRLTYWDVVPASFFLVQSFRFWHFACGMAKLNRRMLTEEFATYLREKESRKRRQ